MRARFPEYLIPIGGKWQKIFDKDIELMPAEERDVLDEYIYHYQINPLSFSLAHGRPSPTGNDVLDMWNDYDNDLPILTAPNQCGKSYSAATYIALRTIPCDPNWVCFKEHGLKYHEWAGPKIVVIASYTWDAVAIVWNTYKKIIPREELGAYAPMYGIFPNEKGKPKDLAFATGQTKQIKLKCGTQLVFLCYRQSLSQWESRQCDIAHCDEQCPEDHFDALTARQVTRGDHTPIIMSLTGHVIPDRPDTGAAGWIKRKVIDQGMTKGRKVKQYKIAVEDVPDAIMTPATKHKLYIQWVIEPEKNNDDKKLREAKARYWGEWEEGGALTFSMFNTQIHVIQPFDYKKYKPTYFRMIDHGETPCAAAIFALMPWGDLVMVKEYYEWESSIEKNAIKIIEWSGNSRRKIDVFESGGRVWDVYEEVFQEMEPFISEMDTRSFGRKIQLVEGETIGTMYNRFGLYCTRATGQHDKITQPILKQWMSLNTDRMHINYRLGREHGTELARFGAPRFYVFSTCQNAISEITGYIGEDKNDHLIATMKWVTARDPEYQDDFRVEDEPMVDKSITISSYTGY